MMDENGKYVFQPSGNFVKKDDDNLKVPMSKFPKSIDKYRNEIDDLRYLNAKLTHDIKIKNKTHEFQKLHACKITSG